jgi:hypothetical protein
MTWDGHGLGFLMATLHYDQHVRVDGQRLLAEVSAALPGTVLLGVRGDVVVLAHHGHVGAVVEGTPVPVQTAVAPVGDYPAFRDQVDLSQTWGFPQARQTLARCHAALSVVEMMGRALPAAQRLLVFRETVLAICRLAQPLATWWPTATQVLPALAPGDEPLMGLLNVRLFRVEGTSDVVMDTLGLHTFGLPDLQCHCRGLEASRLAALLGDAGAYIFEHGDVIEDGHTLEGLEPGQRWACQHEKALLHPDRVVIDIDPGVLHAAGGRPERKPEARS